MIYGDIWLSDKLSQIYINNIPAKFIRYLLFYRKHTKRSTEQFLVLQTFHYRPIHFLVSYKSSDFYMFSIQLSLFGLQSFLLTRHEI